MELRVTGETEASGARDVVSPSKVGDADGINGVAERLAEAFTAGPKESRRVLGALYADRVALNHLPALASDGVVDGVRLSSSNDKEAGAIATAISDQFYEDVEVTVSGEVVEVRASMCGTLRNGESVCLPLLIRCIVDDARIVAITYVMTDGAMKAWAEVAVAGGISAAAPLTQA